MKRTIIVIILLATLMSNISAITLSIFNGTQYGFYVGWFSYEDDTTASFVVKLPKGNVYYATSVLYNLDYILNETIPDCIIDYDVDLENSGWADYEHYVIGLVNVEYEWEGFSTGFSAESNYINEYTKELTLKVWTKDKSFSHHNLIDMWKSGEYDNYLYTDDLYSSLNHMTCTTIDNGIDDEGYHYITLSLTDTGKMAKLAEEKRQENMEKIRRLEEEKQQCLTSIEEAKETIAHYTERMTSYYNPYPPGTMAYEDYQKSITNMYIIPAEKRIEEYNERIREIEELKQEINRINNVLYQ